MPKGRPVHWFESALCAIPNLCPAIYNLISRNDGVDDSSRDSIYLSYAPSTTSLVPFAHYG